LNGELGFNSERFAPVQTESEEMGEEREEEIAIPG
jgi:hypothetical protein